MNLYLPDSPTPPTLSAALTSLWAFCHLQNGLVEIFQPFLLIWAPPACPLHENGTRFGGRWSEFESKFGQKKHSLSLNLNFFICKWA